MRKRNQWWPRGHNRSNQKYQLESGGCGPGAVSGKTKNISWRNTRPVDRIPLAKKIMEHLTDSEETNMRSKW